MKRLTIHLALFSIIASCNNPQSIRIPDTKSEAETLKSKFMPVLVGSWVLSKYIDSVRISKSPLKSENALEEFVQLVIDPKNITGDSLEISAINIHEGTSIYLHFRKGDHEGALPLSLISEIPNSHFELGYKFSNADTTLVLYHLNSQNLVLSEIKYEKVSLTKGSAFEYKLNEALISGIYSLIDSSGQSRTATFSKDGQITGIPGFTKYYVLADFVTEENPTDQIGLGNETGYQVWYTFKFSSDTLSLFDPWVREEKANLKPPYERYRLIKLPD